ncbi:MAG: XamI family restriction endonuclease [Patescibacteria group bacterium]
MKKENKIYINSDKVQEWKGDVAKSVDYYNQWFLNFAPKAYRDTRSSTAEKVLLALEQSFYLTDISPQVLRANPGILSILRMTTRPPIARDRLIGLSGVPINLVGSMEKGSIPSRMDSKVLEDGLEKISEILKKLIDTDIFTWLEKGGKPNEEEKNRASIIIADRLCGMLADPIIRNAQEKRQLEMLSALLNKKGYALVKSGQSATLESLKPGTYSLRLNVPVSIGDDHKVNIPIDVVIRPKDAARKPILIEAKSAGDFTNTNKRRKEEAVKYAQIKATYGKDVPFLLFLCGYFDSGYLGYEAAEGIDWIWEHRMEDFDLLDL